MGEWLSIIITIGDKFILPFSDLYCINVTNLLLSEVGEQLRIDNKPLILHCCRFQPVLHAAIRETREEFGINIADIIPVTLVSGMSEEYCPSQVFLCTEYYGEPICFNTEMENARFEDAGTVLNMNLFLPFRLSLEDFLLQLNEIRLTADESPSNISIEADGGPSSGRYPKGSGKKNEKSSSKKKKPKSLPMTVKEKAKVTHDINNIYHAKYEGKRSCIIRTSSNEPDSPSYVYRFRNNGFDDYDIYSKEPNE